MPPTPEPTPSPTEDSGLSGDITDFTYMGTGWCRSAADQYYDYVRLSASLMNIEICGMTCLDNGGLLKGFSTYGFNFCYCWYENGGIPQPPPSGSYHYHGFIGSGPVARTTGYGGNDCYKYDLS